GGAYHRNHGRAQRQAAHRLPRPGSDRRGGPERARRHLCGDPRHPVLLAEEEASGLRPDRRSRYGEAAVARETACPHERTHRGSAMERGAVARLRLIRPEGTAWVRRTCTRWPRSTDTSPMSTTAWARCSTGTSTATTPSSTRTTPIPTMRRSGS